MGIVTINVNGVLLSNPISYIVKKFSEEVNELCLRWQKIKGKKIKIEVWTNIGMKE